MKRQLVLVSLLFLSIDTFAILGLTEKKNPYGLGVDLSQNIYYFYDKKVGFNGAVAGFYKPYNFLSLNGAFYYNHVRSDNGNAYFNMKDYRSIGTCFKLGPELSLRIRKTKKLKQRLGWGYQLGFLNFREQAHFVFDEPVWGNYEVDLKTPQKHYRVWEYDFNYQLEAKHWLLKLQVYGLFNSGSRAIDRDNRMFADYKVVFVPGYGYSRGGINVLLFYKFH